ncbi:RHS repeat-associated core domain-containing protein [Harryflintia acetispora]|uniref:RHS repeat-associated protein n=1 Tax=Harryflintia acetispora TaxID=1849041 RepID=A0A9X8UHE0_9FIRM|nr:RHS repeat-associated protein [Harryflintia acetispora]
MVSYAYDRFSNRRTMTVTKADGKAVMSSYEYDLRSRLLKETKKDKTSEEIYVYRYDWNGNQLQRFWERYEQSKGRTEPGRVSFAKKKAGAVVICERRAYNGLNQLTNLYQDGEVTKYRYRPDGLRLCKEKADGTEASHIWDGSEMVAEYQANGTVIARYLRGINLIARELDGQQEYYLHNAHGDVVQRTDRYGTPLKSYDYDAFGNEEKPEELDHNPWRYCGEYLDLEVQNYYLRARCYEPRTGRFTQQDSVAYTTAKLPNGTEVVDPLSLNLYTYCGNNPVMFKDSSGKSAEAIFVGGWTLAGIISQADSPMPGPADVVALIIGAGVTIIAGIIILFERIKKVITKVTKSEIPSAPSDPTKLPKQGTIEGDVEGAPNVDAGKQGKHVKGHPNYKEGSSTWADDNTGVHETQEGWLNGTELPDGTKIWDSGRELGTNGETGVRIHIDKKGNLHGYPVNPRRYLPN